MADTKSKLTTRDIELLVAGIQCISEGGLPTAGQLDMAKFASMTGLGDASARTTWGVLRRKVLAADEDGIALKTPGSATKKAPTKRKSTGGKKGENGEDVDGEENADATAETPTKKARSRAPKAKVTEAVGDEDSEIKDNAEVEDTTPVKKKTAAKKPAAAKKGKASSKTPEAGTAPEKTESSAKSAQIGSDDTAHENESITVESAKETVEVEVKNEEIEVTVTEKDNVVDGETVALS